MHEEKENHDHPLVILSGHDALCPLCLCGYSTVSAVATCGLGWAIFGQNSARSKWSEFRWQVRQVSASGIRPPLARNASRFAMISAVAYVEPGPWQASQPTPSCGRSKRVVDGVIEKDVDRRSSAVLVPEPQEGVGRGHI